MFVVHPVNVCGNVPLVSDDGDGFAVVVFESHLNHFVILLSYLHYTDGCDKSGHFSRSIARIFSVHRHHVGGHVVHAFAANLNATLSDRDWETK